MKKINKKKARELEEKQRRLREKIQAAEIKRKEKEDAAKKRALQIEEERRIMTELAAKRKEIKVRYIFTFSQLSLVSHVIRISLLKKADDPKKRLEELLTGAINKVKVPTTVTPSDRYVLSKSKPQPLLDNNANTSTPTSNDQTPPTNTASTLNSTFVVTNIENCPPPSSSVTTHSHTPTHNKHYHLMTGSALASMLAAKGEAVADPQSYAMTPAESDPLYVYENYDIGNLSSEDSTDDEECPKKVNEHSGALIL